MASAGDGRDEETETTQETEETTAMIVRRETRALHCLRLMTVGVLAVVATFVSLFGFYFIRDTEDDEFKTQFGHHGSKIVSAFQINSERRLSALEALSMQITSHSMSSNETLPLASLPDFERKATVARELAQVLSIVNYVYVTDENRGAWEEYSVKKQGWLLEGLTLQREVDESVDKDNLDIIEDLASEMQEILPFIWGWNDTIGSEGRAPAAFPESKVYFPIWQVSPAIPLPLLINFNAYGHANRHDQLNNIRLTNQIQVSPATDFSSPEMQGRKAVLNLFLNRWLKGGNQYQDGPVSDLYVPIFKTFDTKNKELAGILQVNLYWQVYFENILPEDAQGIVCILENTCGQSFTYQINGAVAEYIGPGDLHDSRYDHMQMETGFGVFLGKDNTDQLLEGQCIHNVRIYPSRELEGEYMTNNPAVFSVFLVAVFVIITFIFVLYDWIVRCRHTVVHRWAVESGAQLVKQAEESAENEKELNEYMAHEVRNPLAAALSASHFVTSAIQNDAPITSEARNAIREDVGVIESSLNFINELLRSSLDAHRASNNRMTLNEQPVGILHDVLEPVSSLIYSRDANYRIILECAGDLVVETDKLRLNQLLINLVRNASKFVDEGWIRLSAEVVNGEVHVSVTDTGPGIPGDKQDQLFLPYQESLDMLSQGTGLGLNLCKKIITLMGGEIWLDKTYSSGYKEYPGTRIVVNLKKAPFADVKDIEEGLPEEIKVNNEQTAPEENTFEKLPEELSVLFVDDDRILRKQGARAIRRLRPKWNIREAASGETCLQLCETETFDLIFMDMYMTSTEQSLKGTETVRALRSKGVEQSIICGLSANDLGPAFLCAGANAFHLKPFPCKKEELGNLLLGLLSTDTTLSESFADAA